MWWRVMGTFAAVTIVDGVGHFVRSLARYYQGLPPENFSSGPLILSVVAFAVMHSLLWKRGPLNLFTKEPA